MRNLTPPFVFRLALAALLLANACSDGDKKGIGGVCTNNTDCADEVCHRGICASKNPLANGQPCRQDAQCKSFVCRATCQPGTQTAGGACRFDEECAAPANCVGGRCGAPLLDAGTEGGGEAGPAVCGNGVREGSEQCDDNNRDDLDGCSAQCLLEQSVRLDRLDLQFGSDATCSRNAFGAGVVNPVVQQLLQQAISNGVNAFKSNVLLTFGELDDLSGRDDPQVSCGVLSGTPAAGGGGALDWWYVADAQSLTAQRQPRDVLPGSVSGGAFSLGPGSVTVTIDLLGTSAPLRLTDVRATGEIGATSPPTRSSGGGPPGHLASENVDAALVSFETADAKLCGNITALSASQIAVPSLLTGATGCEPAYDTSHSLLDVVVSGCTNSLIGQAIVPTQPDTVDSAASVAGAGAPYTFTVDAQRHVTGCQDKNSQTVALADCLRAAAYSAYLQVHAKRVVIKAPSGGTVERDAGTADAAGADAGGG